MKCFYLRHVVQTSSGPRVSVTLLHVTQPVWSVRITIVKTSKKNRLNPNKNNSLTIDELKGRRNAEKGTFITEIMTLGIYITRWKHTYIDLNNFPFSPYTLVTTSFTLFFFFFYLIYEFLIYYPLFSLLMFSVFLTRILNGLM